MRQRLRAIWDSRELLTYLVTADIKIKYKGTALGAYATFQFLGMFIGGTLGGFVAGRLGFALVPAVCAGLCVLWLVAALRAPGDALEASRQD